MRTSTTSLHHNALRGVLTVALAIGALSALGARAHAAELDPITVSPPAVKTTGRDIATLAPINAVTVNARIAADAETLRNDSGVKLLKDRVQEAAIKACNAADPFTVDDRECIQKAEKDARPQVAAAIAQARKSANATG